jgi:hypothetical protein
MLRIVLKRPVWHNCPSGVPDALAGSGNGLGTKNPKRVVSTNLGNSLTQKMYKRIAGGLSQLASDKVDTNQINLPILLSF